MYIVHIMMYVFRLGELESELSGARERVIQLQVEKEKALADLNNIRKINRTIEKSVIIFIHMHIHVHSCQLFRKTIWDTGARGHIL